jgi:hypothetical protein
VACVEWGRTAGICCLDISAPACAADGDPGDAAAQCGSAAGVDPGSAGSHACIRRAIVAHRYTGPGYHRHTPGRRSNADFPGDADIYAKPHADADNYANLNAFEQPNAKQYANIYV